ncbi:MAG: TadE/TadG family type IV pilus assembly protein [Planctomycetota bacterium]|nr:TadE/TadG family type IV pilus assembly protein [Planctomycetota bacterium]MDA1179121.1 TadE/TadG family type IV pilus assembly protein [Planctomycetota bacterium]
MNSTRFGQSIRTSLISLITTPLAIREKRRGTAVVEFAIVAPVFILLVFGMIEFGRMVMVQQMLTSATREGARMAVVEGAVAGTIETWVEDYLESMTVHNGTATVTPSPLDNAAVGDPVTVTASVTFGNVSWIPVPMYLGNRVLTATSVMRRESSS